MSIPKNDLTPGFKQYPELVTSLVITPADIAEVIGIESQYLPHKRTAEDEYFLLPPRTKRIMDNILRYYYYSEEFEDIAIKNQVFPHFQERVKRLDKKSRIRSIIEHHSSFFTLNYVETIEILAGINNGLSFGLTENELHVGYDIVAKYQSQKADIDNFAKDMAIIMGIYDYSPAIQRRFAELGVDDLARYLGIEGLPYSFSDKPDKYKEIMSFIGITEKDPQKIDIELIAKYFTEGRGKKTFNDLIGFIEQNRSGQEDGGYIIEPGE